MAGSWEPLWFRIRRDAGPASQTSGGTSPRTIPTDQELRDYREEHSPRTLARLKDLGVNFVMIHGYKGAGLDAEQQSLQDAVEFARRCREAGLHVGTYLDSGTLFHEQLNQEIPAARQWVVLDHNAQPIPYITARYRYFRDRNHPEGQAYYRRITKFAVEQIQADLLHYDNYIVGPGWDVNSIDRFQQYLRATFDEDVLAQHGIDPDTARPAAAGSGLLQRAWQDYCCQSLADSYRDLSVYAKTLRADVLVECNPGGVRPVTRPPVDHGRIYPGGDAVWDESGPVGFRNGVLHSRIRTYKIARSMETMVFSYTPTALEMAESMAFNLDCLGVLCLFESSRFTARPGTRDPVPEGMSESVKFFRNRRNLLRDARVVADLAVLRSFPSQVFGPGSTAALTAAIEDKLILNRACFQILHENQLERLNHYRGLVLAGCAALSDEHVRTIRQFVETGGRLCVIGPLATHDEWMRPRPRPLLEDVPADRIRRVTAESDWLAAAAWAAGDPGTLSVTVGSGDPTPGLCLELTEDRDRRMIHLVNYRSTPVNTVQVRLTLPAGRAVHQVAVAGPTHQTDLTVPFQEESGAVRFTIPQVGVYEIAIVTLQSDNSNSNTE